VVNQPQSTKNPTQMPTPHLLRVSTLVTVLALGMGNAAHAVHYRVYLLGGQSNANGRGDASQLTAPLASPQTDVRFYWHRSQVTTNVGWLPEDQWIELAPGSGHGTTAPVYPKEFGSELSFGRAMADANQAARIAIIKYSHGGTNLYSQWSATGEMYATFVATVNAALAALTATGDTYRLVGMIWHQGEADTGAQADDYEANLTSLVNRVRNDVFAGRPAPFVIGSLSNSQYGAEITTPGTGPYKVRLAQQTVAATMPNVGFVNTDGYTTRPGEAIHFDHLGQLALGQGFASEMLRLEDEDTDQDGLLDDEETTLGTDPAKADTDGDGQEDGFEVLRAGTDPRSGNSLFAITDFAVTGNQVSLTWPSMPGNLYAIESSGDLVNWSTVATSHPAPASGTATTWAGTPGGGSSPADVIANFDFTGPPWTAQKQPDFATFAANAPSVDTDSNSVTSILSNSGYTSGGYASFYIRDIDGGTVGVADASDFKIFSTSATPGVGMNVGGANTTTPTHHIAFRVTPAAGHQTTFQSLSFYTGTNAASDPYDIQLRAWDGVTETTLGTLNLPGAAVTNEPVVFKSIDFADFTASSATEFRLYGYNVSTATGGIRYDDIKLFGTTQAMQTEPATRAFLRVRLLP
jgi:hypothetical protein